MKICQLKSVCPGCSLWGIPYADQLKEKQIRLQNLFSELLPTTEIKTFSAGKYGLRQRFDFIVKENKIGLVDKNKNLIPIKECLQLTPELQNAFEIIQGINLNIKIGTLRLRVSSLGQVHQFGLWLDFANTDIKNLLLEKNILRQLSRNFFVEIGQKKKCLNLASFDYEQIKLADPQPQPWFHTYNYKTGQPIKLYCAVSSFTQPSALSAKLITDIIVDWVASESENIWEFGSGIGQYTLPLLSLGHQVSVFENDLFALECLLKSAKENNFDSNLEIHADDFQRPQNITPQARPDTVLVNPPKSGLKNFSHSVVQAKPRKIIYISCYPETLRQDAEVFIQAGYKIIDTAIIDQFPQTSHFEVAMLFQRINM